MVHLCLDKLNDDVLLKIINTCTASEVFTLEKTCRTFQNLLTQPLRSLWLSLLQELEAHQAPIIPLGMSLASLSSDDLKGIVRKTTLGQQNWQSSSPRTARKRIVDLGNKGGLMGNLKPTQLFQDIIRLTPGGDYVGLLWSDGYLQIWNAASNFRLWTYPALGDFPDFQVEAFDLYYENSGFKKLTVLVAGTYLNRPLGMKFLEVFRIDPEAKRVSKIAETTFLAPFKAPHIVDVKFSEKFVAVFGNNGILLYDPSLKTRSGVEAKAVSGSIHVMDRLVFFLNASSRAWSGPLQWSIVVLDVVQVLSRAKSSRSSLQSSGRLLLYSIPATLSAFLHLTSNFKELSICPCLPRWREDCDGSFTITLIGKLEGSEQAYEVLNYRYVPGDIEELGPNARGMISFEGSSHPVVKTPFASPYSTESVKALSQTGRCILASTNNMHKATRYYAFSMTQLLNGNARFGPINFGRNVVGPEILCMDYFSGAIAYPGKEEGTLVLEFFD